MNCVVSQCVKLEQKKHNDNLSAVLISNYGLILKSLMFMTCYYSGSSQIQVDVLMLFRHRIQATLTLLVC